MPAPTPSPRSGILAVPTQVRLRRLPRACGRYGWTRDEGRGGGLHSPCTHFLAVSLASLLLVVECLALPCLLRLPQGLAIFGDDDANVYAVSSATGLVAWTYATTVSYPASLAPSSLMNGDMVTGWLFPRCSLALFSQRALEYSPMLLVG